LIKTQPMEEYFDRTLYHFTTIEKFKRILSEQKLKFNLIVNSDDPNEYKDFNFYFDGDAQKFKKFSTNDVGNSISNINNEANKAKMICFSTNQIDDRTREVIEGWKLPRMWHTYGDRHKGVCIEFNIDHLLVTDNPEFETSFTTYHRVVKY
jgi:Protein of unknown function (DUF2971)